MSSHLNRSSWTWEFNLQFTRWFWSKPAVLDQDLDSSYLSRFKDFRVTFSFFFFTFPLPNKVFFFIFFYFTKQPTKQGGALSPREPPPAVRLLEETLSSLTFTWNWFLISSSSSLFQQDSRQSQSCCNHINLSFNFLPNTSSLRTYADLCNKQNGLLQNIISPAVFSLLFKKALLVHLLEAGFKHGRRLLYPRNTRIRGEGKSWAGCPLRLLGSCVHPYSEKTEMPYGEKFSLVAPSFDHIMHQVFWSTDRKSSGILSGLMMCYFFFSLLFFSSFSQWSRGWVNVWEQPQSMHKTSTRSLCFTLTLLSFSPSLHTFFYRWALQSMWCVVFWPRTQTHHLYTHTHTHWFSVIHVVTLAIYRHTPLPLCASLYSSSTKLTQQSIFYLFISK